MQAITREQFLKTEIGLKTKTELQHMVKSASYNTREAYDATVGSRQTFINRHINYLVKHPGLSPAVYLSNLRVMTKVAR